MCILKWACIWEARLQNSHYHCSRILMPIRTETLIFNRLLTKYEAISTYYYYLSKIPDPVTLNKDHINCSYILILLIQIVLMMRDLKKYQSITLHKIFNLQIFIQLLNLTPDYILLFTPDYVNVKYVTNYGSVYYTVQNLVASLI